MWPQARRGNTGDHSLLGQRVDNGRGGLLQLDGEFIEEAVGYKFTPGQAREFVGERCGPRVIGARKPRESFLAKQREVNRESEAAQPGIRADVAGRLVAADVLLARGQREHKT